jgi:phospholipase C
MRTTLALLLLAGCNSMPPGGADLAGGGPADAAAEDLTVPGDLALPSDLGPAFPTPIRHVIVIVKENHTFDNYFGTFPGAEGTTMCHLQGGDIPCPHAPDRTSRDLCHAHSCALTDWNLGAMNGWEKVSGSDQNGDHLAWAQYHESDIPNYWAYARTYTLADHFFAGELGPSFPGHLFTIAAQAGWALGNPPTDVNHPYWGCDENAGDRIDVLDNGSCVVKQVFPCFKIPSIPDILPQGLTWRFYGTDFVLWKDIWSMFNAVDSVRNGPDWKTHVVNVSEFGKDVQAGTLPNMVWLVDQDLADEHPNVGGVCAGENWTVGFVNQIMNSPYWNDTAILFTMDDFGGWYDHVPPPRQYGCDDKTPYGLGFRLPLIIMSPYAKPGFVFKEVSEHASIAHFVEKVFAARKPLSDYDPAAQDGQANDLLGAFDFTQKPLPPLPLKPRSCP